MKNRHTDKSTKLAAKHFLNALDSEDPTQDSTRVQYQILTRPFKSPSRKARVANKLFHAPLFILKKSFADYLGSQSLTDSTLLADSQETISKVNTLLENNEQLNQEISKKLDDKVYEMMKLNDRLKSELMAEINKDVSPVGDDAKIKTIWVNEKSKALKKLNLGSGSHIMEGYINVDHREIEGVDLVADIRELPLKSDSIQEIYLAHVVEHFTEYHMKDMLKHWFDLLEKGGEIRIVVPDIESMVKGFAKGTISWERLRLVILGGQDYNSDYHFNVFSEAYLTELINNSLPHAHVTTLASGRQNGEALELDIVIKK